mmetsp:Transcript_86120/g.241014  ORF Transcript_86120/g.241014 Transcript_86120/m.241014 type:complete len:294 (-) Transcript_86120:92-973(-)
MGKRGAYTAIGLGVASSATFTVGCLLPWHTLGWYSNVKQVSRFSISPAWVRKIEQDSEPCTWVLTSAQRTALARHRIDEEEFHRDATWFCVPASDGVVGVGQFSERLCRPTLRWIWPSVCEGAKMAHAVGALCLAAIVADAFVLQPLACWLIYDYCARRAEREKRKRVVALLVGGCVVVTSALFLYVIAATMQLDQAGAQGVIFSWLLGAPVSTGFSRGAGVCWAAALAQVAQLQAVAHMRSADEALGKDQERPHAADAEYGATWAAPARPSALPSGDLSPPEEFVAQPSSRA